MASMTRVQTSKARFQRIFTSLSCRYLSSGIPQLPSYMVDFLCSAEFLHGIGRSGLAGICWIMFSCAVVEWVGRVQKKSRRLRFHR
jgi:hypothetical protein